ncbi:MAG: CBS domain-containing protein [Thermoproteota archaeon]|jgi:CBS domain-containing protein|nr:CBS domain-containing protein [Thermoproteota archaeon]
MKKILVKEIMRHDILVTAKPDEKVIDAVEKMAKYKVGSVVIIDDGKVLGIITERDIINLVASKKDLNEKLELYMTKNPITIYFDESLEKAIQIMKEKNIRHLPVVNKEGKLIGMISSRDIIRVSLEYGL